MICNQTILSKVDSHNRITDQSKVDLYEEFNNSCINFLKIENIKEDMLKYAPEICSDLQDNNFLHINRGVVGPPNASGRKEYLDFFKKSYGHLLEKYDIIREKDALIFEKAGY